VFIAYCPEQGVESTLLLNPTQNALTLTASGRPSPTRARSSSAGDASEILARQTKQTFNTLENLANGGHHFSIFLKGSVSAFAENGKIVEAKELTSSRIGHTFG